MKASHLQRVNLRLPILGVGVFFLLMGLFNLRVQQRGLKILSEIKPTAEAVKETKYQPQINADNTDQKNKSLSRLK